MTDLSVFREYEPRECGADGYPWMWHQCQTCMGEGAGPYLEGWTEEEMTDFACPCAHCLGAHSVKELVRAEAGYRCVRCGHPYRPGAGTWGTSEGYPQGSEPPPSGLLFNMEQDPDIREVARQMKIRPPLWSPCDERCTHGGPVRQVWPNGAKASRPDGSTDPYGSAGEMVREGYNGIEAAWRILTVHHLNERKHDLRWWNLASLCQRCHLHIQKKVTMEAVFPLEHTEWFKPYAAGWYAYAYEGLHLTREQTMEMLPELLALERMA